MDKRYFVNELWAMRRMRIVVQILAGGHLGTVPVLAKAWGCEPTIEALARVAMEMYREEFKVQP